MYTIGKLAREAGVNADTVRFYERQGLFSGKQEELADTVAALRAMSASFDRMLASAGPKLKTPDGARRELRMVKRESAQP